MLAFKKWLVETGGTPWDAAPLQHPWVAYLDGDRGAGSAFPRYNPNELPPAKKKFGKQRFLMKKKMKA